MPVEFIDGFDLYTALNSRWAVGVVESVVSSTYARPYGGNGVRSHDGWMEVALSSFSQSVLGFAVNLETVIDPFLPLARLTGPMPGTFNHLHLYATGSSKIHLTLFDDARHETADLAILGFGAWHYIDVVLALTGGGNGIDVSNPITYNCRVWIDGIKAIDVVNYVSPSTVAIASVLTYRLGKFGASVGPAVRFDDVYIIQDALTFLNDVRMRARQATGAGNYAAWTPSAGANWDAVNETPPNEDTDYVSTAGAGSKDSHVTEDVGTTGTIHAVGVLVRAKDGGVKPLVRYNAIDSTGTQTVHGAGYSSAQQIFDVAPGAVGWTPTVFDASEFGVEST